MFAITQIPGKRTVEIISRFFIPWVMVFPLVQVDILCERSIGLISYFDVDDLAYNTNLHP